ncbi:hypothetical protein [Burkholderia contaminans]|uniref:hypothetical protein n=1 Tax=Burkholderia contaminans TaxID=488447 RepID=UPI001C898751|nr:hypothetical protein [Burkholderia contaminans]
MQRGDRVAHQRNPSPDELRDCATHVATGLSVRVESERGQHANKRLALQLLQVRLQQEADRHASEARRQRRMQHFALERGNPVRVFYGAAFVPAD